MAEQTVEAEPSTTDRRRWAALLVVLVGQFMASVDTTVANVAAPSIGEQLRVSAGTVQLAVAAYTLCYASGLITGARLGAEHGRRRVFLLGALLFTVASAGAGCAGGGGTLVATRAAQGVGAALMVPQIVSIIQAEYTGRARTRALAVWGTMISLGAAVGLAAGGALMTLDLFGWGWRLAFLINVPAGIALLLVARRVIPTIETRPRSLDGTGVALLSVTALAFTVPLALGHGAGWPPWSFALLAAGPLLATVFVLHERRVGAAGRQPLFDVAVMASPGMRRGLIALFLSGTAYTGVLFCVAAHLQDHAGHGALAAGLALLPFAVGFGLGSPCGPVVPPARQPMVVVSGLVLLGAVLLVLAGIITDGAWPAVPAGLLLGAAGFGYGASFNPLVGLTVAGVEPRHIPDASGIATTTYQFSYVAGVAGFGTVYDVAGLSVALAGIGLLALAAAVAVPRRAPSSR